MTEKSEHLTPGQQAIKTFADTVLNHSAIRYDIPNKARPTDVVEQLQKLRVPDLLLRRGAHPDPMEYSSERGLYIGPKTLMRGIGKVGLRVSRWDHTEEVQIWERKLELSIAYSNHSQDALQTFSVYTSSQNPGTIPTISRGMSMSPDSYDDITGEYSMKTFAVSDETVVAFTGICQAAFNLVDLKRMEAA